MATSTDCKQFLASLIANNPELLPMKDPVILGEASTPKYWKRMYKCKPNHPTIGFGSTVYYVYDTNLRKYVPKPYTDFIAEREFVLDEPKYEDSFRFQVMEALDGTLYLGEFTGD